MAAVPHQDTASLGIHQWQCRVCGYERFHRVVVPKGNNTYYTTQFHACSRCSVMFLLPASFNALNPAPTVDVRTVTEFRIPRRT